MKFYIPYLDYSDKTFEVDSSYYKDKQSYIDALNNEFNSTNDILNQVMSNGMSFSMGNYGSKIGMNGKITAKPEKMAYTISEGKLIDDEENTISVEKLLGYYRDGSPFVCLMCVDMENMEERFEGEIKSWATTTNNVMIQDRSQEWIFNSKPTLDIYFSMENKTGETVYGCLCGCKMEEIIDRNEYVIIVTKVEFLKNL